MDPSRTTVFLGPPGTGKTTRLIAEVEASLGRGVAPESIGYVSFTRRAAEEAITRAVEKFGLSRSVFPYFRTLHALCFRQLSLNRKDVMEGESLERFEEYAGIRLTRSSFATEGGIFEGHTRGDRIMYMINLARIRQVPLRQLFDEGDDRLSWAEVERVALALKMFKTENGLLDYSDMLEQFASSNLDLKLRELFVDEAQDLSELQWSVVERLAVGAERIVVAGDDDQAIYRWAGAAVERFIALEGREEVLGQSYRVPRNVQALASHVLLDVRSRRAKAWEPRAEGGEVEAVDAGVVHNHIAQEGTVLFLARNIFILDEFVAPMLRQFGYVFERDGKSSIPVNTLHAIVAWETLRRGEPVRVHEVRLIYDLMDTGKGVKRGFKTLAGWDDDALVVMTDLVATGGLLTQAIWHQALTRIPHRLVGYIVAVLRRREKLTARPRIRISTIHGSKGGEADQVVLYSGMSRRTREEMERRTREDEARVWYVAITRARQRLTIVSHQRVPDNYPLWRSQ